METTGGDGGAEGGGGAPAGAAATDSSPWPDWAGLVDWPGLVQAKVEATGARRSDRSPQRARAQPAASSVVAGCEAAGTPAATRRDPPVAPPKLRLVAMDSPLHGKAACSVDCMFI